MAETAGTIRYPDEGGKPVSSQGELGARTESRTVKADDDNSAIIKLASPAGGTRFHIERITVLSDSPTNSEARIYLGSPVPRNFADGTPRGNLDIAEYPNPLILPAGETLTCVWTGVTPNSECTLRVQYQIVRDF